MKNKTEFELNYKSTTLKGSIVARIAIGFGEGTGIREFLKENSIGYKMERGIEKFFFLENKDCYRILFGREILTRMEEDIHHSMIFDYVEHLSLYIPISHNIPRNLIYNLFKHDFKEVIFE